MKRFWNIAIGNAENFSFNNLVDKDVQSILLPLNLMQYFMFCPKYRIHNNFISPNTLISYFVPLIGILTFIVIYGYYSYLLFFDPDSSGFPEFADVFSFFCDAIFYCFGAILNFGLGIINSKRNIKFVIIYQQVHRFLNSESSSKRFTIWNWITVTMFSLFFLVYIYFFIKLKFPPLLFYSMCVVMFINCNVIYVTRVLKLLEDKLSLWNVKALNFQNIEATLKPRYCERVFQAYVTILDCYSINNDCYQSLILYHIITTLLHSLGYIQITVTHWTDRGFRNMDETILISMPLLIWVTKNMTWQTILNRQCEKFYSALRSVQDTCAIILKSNCSDEEKKLCKNVLRLHRASFSKIRVCGLIYLDAALQLNLMSLLTNYTVVLLQFAFL